MMLFWPKSTVWCLLLLPVLTSAQEPLPFSKGKKYISAFLEYSDEQRQRSGISKTALRFNYEEYHAPGFSLGGEFTFNNYTGQRDGIESGTVALGINYLIKWHFIRKKKFGAFFEHGAGPIYSFEGFPANGTNLNAMFVVGGSMLFFLSQHSYISSGIRDFHSSNGRGFVPTNPSYDATLYYLGITLNIK